MANVRDLEVDQRPDGRAGDDAVHQTCVAEADGGSSIGVRRHLAVTEKVMFHTELCRCHGPLFLPVMIFHDISRSSFPARSRFTRPCKVTRRSGRLSMNLRRLGSDQRM